MQNRVLRVQLICFKCNCTISSLYSATCQGKSVNLQKRSLTFFFAHFLCSTLLYVYHLNKNTTCCHLHSNTDHLLCCHVLPPSNLQINNNTWYRIINVLYNVHNLAEYHKITCRNTLLVLRHKNIPKETRIGENKEDCPVRLRWMHHKWKRTFSI